VKRALAPAALFLALLAVYAALRQDVQYGDGISFLVQLRERFLCSHNWLYLPALDGFARVLGPWAPEPVAAGLFSAVCAAGGGALLLAWLHATCQDLLAAGAATLLVSLSPAILFFATTIENHAHHLLWVTALLLVLHWSCANTPAATMLLPGLFLVGVFGSHQTGILLTPGVLLLLAAWCHGQGRGWSATGARAAWLLLPLAVVKLTRLDLWFKAEVLGGGEAFRTDEGFKVFKEQVLGGVPPAAWPDYWLSDLLLPAGGLVLMAVVGVLRARRGREFAAVGAAVVPYLLFFARWHIPERGAYYTAIWPLFALCACRGLAAPPPRGRVVLLASCAVVIVVQAWVGVARIQDFERADPYRPFARQLGAALPAGGLLLTSNDQRALHGKYWAGVDAQDLQHLLNLSRIAEGSHPGALARFPAIAVQDLTGRLARGQRIVIDQEAWRFAADQWPALAQALDSAFRRTALLPDQGLAGFRLEAR
jgi:hypothetical protein